MADAFLCKYITETDGKPTGETNVLFTIVAPALSISTSEPDLSDVSQMAKSQTAEIEFDYPVYSIKVNTSSGYTGITNQFTGKTMISTTSASHSFAPYTASEAGDRIYDYRGQYYGSSAGSAVYRYYYGYNNNSSMYIWLAGDEEETVTFDFNQNKLIVRSRVSLNGWYTNRSGLIDYGRGSGWEEISLPQSASVGGNEFRFECTVIYK